MRALQEQGEADLGPTTTKAMKDRREGEKQQKTDQEIARKALQEKNRFRC